MMTRQNERGVTMVELLVTISLLGLIAAALTSAMATGLRSTEQTQDTVLTSRDTQLITLWFSKDVRSSANISLSNTSCSGVAPIIHLARASGSVAYFARTTGGVRSLVRADCTAGPAVERVIARSLDTAVAPSVGCSPAPCNASTRRVTLTVPLETGDPVVAAVTRRVT